MPVSQSLRSRLRDPLKESEEEDEEEEADLQCPKVTHSDPTHLPLPHPASPEPDQAIS